MLVLHPPTGAYNLRSFHNVWAICFSLVGWVVNCFENCDRGVATSIWGPRGQRLATSLQRLVDHMYCGKRVIASGDDLMSRPAHARQARSTQYVELEAEQSRGVLLQVLTS